MANIVAGRSTKTDEMVSMLLTCKYMGWDWHTYQRQPREFIYLIDTFRKVEAEEVAFQNKKSNK